MNLTYQLRLTFWPPQGPLPLLRRASFPPPHVGTSTMPLGAFAMPLILSIAFEALASRCLTVESPPRIGMKCNRDLERRCCFCCCFCLLFLLFLLFSFVVASVYFCCCLLFILFLLFIVVVGVIYCFVVVYSCCCFCNCGLLLLWFIFV